MNHFASVAFVFPKTPGMPIPTRKTFYLVLILAAMGAFGFSCANKKAKTHPNIVFILADDLGYGDLSCYGQKKFSTPNIDALAARGMLFTQHYAGTTVCAPSRSSLMTGQDTGHTPIRGNRSTEPEGQWPLPAASLTIAEVLKGAGYATGAFGKWGLGYIETEGDPNKQGFYRFYGYNCQALAHNYYPDHLWNNHERVSLTENAAGSRVRYAPHMIHEQAMQFVEANRERPFFLYYASVIPHAELVLPEKHMEAFRGKYLPEPAYKGTEPGDPAFQKGGYATQPEPHAAFAAMVTLLDQQVGELMTKLKELDLDKNTIVIFSSDNGPHLEGGADPDYFDSNGLLRGYKRDLYEGGIRVPMIVSWTDRIAAQSISHHVSAFWDVLPTITDLLGLPQPADTQGLSFLPTLLGESGQPAHEYLYWEFIERGGAKAIRKGDWKLVVTNVLHPDKAAYELYNLREDEGEQHNVAHLHEDVVMELKQLLLSARVPAPDFPFE